MADKLVAGTNNSFFGDLGKAFTDTFAAALPVWTAQQLQDQSKDQLSQPLFAAQFSAPRSGPIVSSGNTATLTSEAVPTKASLIQFGGTSVGGLTVALAVVGVVAAFLLLRK